MAQIINHAFPLGLIEPNNTSVVIGLSEDQKTQWIKQFIAAVATTTADPGLCLVIVTPDSGATDAWIQYLQNNVHLFAGGRLEIYKFDENGILEPVNGIRIGTRCPYIAVGEFKSVFYQPMDAVLYDASSFPIKNIIVDFSIKFSDDDFNILRDVLIRENTFNIKLSLPKVSSMDEIKFIKTLVNAQIFVALQPVPVSLQKKDKLALLSQSIDDCASDSFVLVLAKDFVEIKEQIQDKDTCKDSAIFGAYFIQKERKQIIFETIEHIATLDILFTNNWINYDIEEEDIFLFKHGQQSGVFLFSDVNDNL